MNYERERLRQAGEKRLGDRVEHVAVAKGDGLGYDVLSFDVDGRERFIEVKTTSFGKQTPFFVSRNELEFSDLARDQYHLYTDSSSSAGNPGCSIWSDRSGATAGSIRSRIERVSVESSRVDWPAPRCAAAIGADRGGRFRGHSRRQCCDQAGSKGRTTRRTPSAVQTRLTVSKRGALPGRKAL